MALVFTQNRPQKRQGDNALLPSGNPSLENEVSICKFASAHHVGTHRSAWSEERPRTEGGNKSPTLTRTARSSESLEWSGRGSGAGRWRKQQPWPSSCSSTGSHQSPSWRWWARHTPRSLTNRGQSWALCKGGGRKPPLLGPTACPAACPELSAPLQRRGPPALPAEETHVRRSQIPQPASHRSNEYSLRLHLWPLLFSFFNFYFIWE